MASDHTPQQLKRELGIWGAVLMGLGSIVGTGVFVSVGIAANIAGPAVILAIAIGAIVATCNGLSSAQLAANHAVSGGTYEYGYRYLSPRLGFIAGWLFLLAKSASAATAALGFAGYLLGAFGIEGIAEQRYLIPTAIAAVVLFTVLVLSGIKRSNVANIAIVSITLLTLAFFITFGIGNLAELGTSNLVPFFKSKDKSTFANVLHASALMFVAYTGYGRIATLGEEVKEPRRTIPRAMITAMIVIALLYICVGLVSVGLGVGNLPETTTQAAPLEAIAQNFNFAGSAQIMAVGAITAMLGVLLNLILGLSRVLLAMGRRQDMPIWFAWLNRANTTPYVAVTTVGIAIALLVLIGNVRTTWSFSAFNVLIYYAITNLASLQLNNNERLYPRWISIVGLASCLFLAFWVEWQIWLVGLGIIAIGLGWHTLALRLKQNSA
ncbi:amino acid/polyamine/organocation transporter, APC superfamily [Thalassoporum mexicanum PCC 7367]|uniref:APC family permease n=1 Tax=Thalassoporum mexicanum TaxID=3457544 RepID=UPI00029FFFB9|nr:amino acid permease [Pseudanabaena sp. PCC 7367]AFY68835.1 amino acid/polyamine/organocation transporter, APC superfamily [Pseudanabaena sp. PCC 7367]